MSEGYPTPEFSEPSDIYLTPESIAIRLAVDALYDRLEPWVFEASEG